MKRIYLDWNASWPLRAQARDAMVQAIDVTGNPSSVHSEGRGARAIIEKARAQIAALTGSDPTEVIFTSGATESANTVLSQGWDVIVSSGIEHDAINVRLAGGAKAVTIPVATILSPDDAKIDALLDQKGDRKLLIVHVANGEVGVLPPYMALAAKAQALGYRVLADATQLMGKAAFCFSAGEATAHTDYAILSAHKIGGPKGIGALLVKHDAAMSAFMQGGGHEKGRRSGTENLIGIAGFGAAAEAAMHDNWAPVETMRDALELALTSASSESIVVGKNAPRLQNTLCIATPGWKGETQVMQMDLAGFAISAGSACSSGKVRPSRVLQALGFDDLTATSAIRVSLGPTTSEADVMAFAAVWEANYKRWKSRAA